MKLRILVAALAAFTLAACGQAAPTHNQADVDFATGMVPHHRQAVEMADLIPQRSDNPKLRSLGERVRAAQQPEIDTMTGWLKRWGAPEPSDHSGHSGHGMAGMMMPQQMADLKAAKGIGFDKMWLRMMIEHHKGALEMARTELAKGSDAEAKKLAQSITDSQQKEIDEMTALLAER
ncbi:DUF305 domain-containing protein [Allokutzneria albata]|uniref:Uncharacterized conserved protein, DUF305 family n=1 Tax=Allokutzneria albata TaxID=211114 RepID=A0A1G9XWS2_ALLAB|nr:DUF305 domain-containing protein [Allokutzneria albata]SDN01237.1 Uncharacterized conserved protein, DUF305 family [Allokutzneria albata]